MFIEFNRIFKDNFTVKVVFKYTKLVIYFEILRSKGHRLFHRIILILNMTDQKINSGDIELEQKADTSKAIAEKALE